MDFWKNDTIEYFFAIQKRKGQNKKMEENETTKLTRMPATNSGLAKGGLTCFVETFVLKQTFVLRMNFCSKNSAIRQAANR
jgi:hypothetical protein